MKSSSTNYHSMLSPSSTRPSSPVRPPAGKCSTARAFAIRLRKTGPAPHTTPYKPLRFGPDGARKPLLTSRPAVNAPGQRPVRRFETSTPLRHRSRPKALPPPPSHVKPRVPSLHPPPAEGYRRPASSPNYDNPRTTPVFSGDIANGHDILCHNFSPRIGLQPCGWARQPLGRVCPSSGEPFRISTRGRSSLEVGPA